MALRRHFSCKNAAVLGITAVFCYCLAAPPALAIGSALSLSSDTAVLLTGPSITLTLASGSTLVSYSADTATLTLNLDASSNVTVKSNNLYTLTNSQSQSTLCNASPAYSYVTFTATGPSAITLTPTTAVACSNTAPVIASFNAVPASVTPGGASILSWSISGADTASIDNGLGLQSNASSSSVSVTPAQTSLYTLTAVNYLGTTTAQTTVTVSPPTVTAGGTMASVPTAPSATSSPVTSITPVPTQSASSTTPTTTAAPATCLVNHSGTFFLILNGIRHGIANPGLLYSYGYNFKDAISDTATYQALPSGDIVGPNDGSVVKAPKTATVYLISGQTKHGFSSAKIFTSLGYKFSSVLTIPAAQLNALSGGTIISDPKFRHMAGAAISSKGTIYLLGDSARSPYPSLSVFNTWNLHNDFSRVLPANDADMALPVGYSIIPRSRCGQ